MKKVISFLLTVTMLLSLLVLPTSAADAPTVTMQTIAFTEGGYRILEGNQLDQVSENETFAVKVLFTNTTSDTFVLGAYGLKISYDSEAFELYSYSGEETTIGPIAFAAANNGGFDKWSTTPNTNIAGTAIFVSSGISYKTVKTGETATLGYLLLKAKEGVETGNYDFPFIVDGEDLLNENYVTIVKSGENVKPERIPGIDYSSSNKASIHVNGVTPTLNTVTLDKDSVTVDGETGKTVNATAASVQSTNLTSMVNWTVVPANSGVSIDNAGVITVAKNAKAGDYTITATPKNGSSQGDAKSATLKVERATPVYTVTVTPESKGMTVPASGENKESFSATVTNQYDETMTEGVMWSITPNDDNVSINSSTGEVTVKAAAKDTIQNTTGENFMVTATYGENKAEDTATLTVKRADSVVKSMDLAASAAKSVIPADGTNMTVTLSISDVKDQYGADAVLNGNVEWTADIGGTRFAQNGNGGYTATLSTAEVLKAFNGNRNEEGVTVTFTAKCGDVQDSARVKLTLDGAVAKKIVLTSEPAGEAIIIPTGDTPNTKTYKAAVKDQYGFAMNDAKVTYEMTSSDEKVTFNAATATVSVAKGAKAEQSYTVTATVKGTDVTASHNFKVANKKDPGLTITGENEVTYGDTFMLTASAANHGTAGGKWGVSGINSSILEVDKHDGSKLTLKALKAGKTKVTMTYEDEEYYGTKTVEVTVTPKEVPVGQGSFKVSKVYNGTTAAGTGSGNLTVSGIRAEDSVTVTPTIPAYTDANVGGQAKLTLSLALTGDGSDNYKLENATVEVPCEITPATLTIASATATNRGYVAGKTDVEISGVMFTNTSDTTVVPTAGEYTASGEMSDANAGTKDVTVTVTLTGQAAKNYTLTNNTCQTKVSIDKIDWAGSTKGRMGAKYGNTATLDLKTIGLPDGYQFGSIDYSKTDGYSIIDSAALNGDILSVTLVDNSGYIGKKAQVIVRGINSTNYNEYAIIVDVEMIDKSAQTIEADDVIMTYGNSAQVNVKNASALHGAVSYSVTGGSDVIRVDSNGKITALKSGTATVEISAAGDSDYAAATKSITVTVAKRTLTVKAADKSAYVGEKQPELTYEVTGLVDSDKLTKEPTLKLVHEAEADPMKTAGEYVITFDQAPAADAAKYDLVTADGKLTVSVRPVYVGPIGSPVEVGRSDNGTVTVSPANAAKGTTVTITANPGKGQELKSLEVIDQNGNSLPLTDLGNGKFSFVMPAGKVTVKPVFGAADAYRNPYADVQTNDWYFGAVQYVTENGLMNGTGNGFEPNLATSRAMIWTILARMSDVNTASSGEWYAVAQQWAIANGVSDGTMPNGTITREQLAAMLYRYAVSKGMVKGPATADLSVFADANSVSSYAVEAMQWAVSAGLIGGMDGKLNPQGSATRAQVATMLMRFAELAK